MKQLKFILLCLFVAVYTSSWWAASIFGKEDYTGLWLVPGTMTFIVFFASFVYLCENWNKD